MSPIVSNALGPVLPSNGGQGTRMWTVSLAQIMKQINNLRPRLRERSGQLSAVPMRQPLSPSPVQQNTAVMCLCQLSMHAPGQCQHCRYFARVCLVSLVEGQHTVITSIGSLLSFRSSSSLIVHYLLCSLRILSRAHTLSILEAECLPWQKSVLRCRPSRQRSH